ncbi:MAG TPA: hypothetical protein VFE51_08535 [Verrucomicrobiae bacterium]|nr:hypothetical protein [Verrucomicrobiae bacterium]
MSWVTDVILCINLEEKFRDDADYSESCEPVDSTNRWLTDHEHGKLDQISEAVVSSGKAMQCFVYGGAFNFLDADEFIKLVLSQEWKMPEAVQLLIKNEEEDAFTMYGSS